MKFTVGSKLYSRALVQFLFVFKTSTGLLYAKDLQHRLMDGQITDLVLGVTLYR